MPAARIRSRSLGASVADAEPATTNATSMKRSGPTVISSMTARTPPFRREIAGPVERPGRDRARASRCAGRAKRLGRDQRGEERERPADDEHVVAVADQVAGRDVVGDHGERDRGQRGEERDRERDRRQHLVARAASETEHAPRRELGEGHDRACRTSRARRSAGSRGRRAVRPDRPSRLPPEVDVLERPSARLEPPQADSEVGDRVADRIVGSVAWTEEEHAAVCGHVEAASRQDRRQLVGPLVHLDEQALRASPQARRASRRGRPRLPRRSRRRRRSARPPRGGVTTRGCASRTRSRCAG